MVLMDAVLSDTIKQSLLPAHILSRLPGALWSPEVRQGKRDQMVQCWLHIGLEVWLPIWDITSLYSS